MVFNDGFIGFNDGFMGYIYIYIYIHDRIYSNGMYPLVMTNIAIENGHRHSEPSHKTW